MLHVFIPTSDLYSGTIMLFVLKTERTRVSRVELYIILGFSTLNFPFCTTLKTETRRRKPRSLIKGSLIKGSLITGLFSCRYNLKTKAQSFQNPDIDQNALRQIYIEQSDS